MRRLFLFINLDFPDPHLFTGNYRYPVTSTTSAFIEERRQWCVSTALHTESTPGWPGNVDLCTLQQRIHAAGFKTEYNGIRDNTAQLADLDIDRKDPAATGMRLTDINDSLCNRHFMHINAPSHKQKIKKSLRDIHPAGFCNPRRESEITSSQEL
jgi:hypothetical protein